MILFKLKTLMYLSFHGIGFLFVMISIMGIPGELDETKNSIKTVMKLMDFLLSAAWTGIPILFVMACVAFYFEYILIGKLCSALSLFLGLGLFLNMVLLYKIK